jgi:hypothetical protein
MVGSELSDEELDAALKSANNDIQEMRSSGRSKSVLAERRAHYEKSTQEAVLQAKRASLFRSLASLDIGKALEADYEGRMGTGILDAVWGGKTSENSAAAISQISYLKYSGLLDTELRKMGDGYLRLYQSGQIDDDVVVAMYALKDGSSTADIDPRAVEVAGAINRTTDSLRRELNEAGYAIPDHPDWVMSQVHDMDIIRKTDREEWTADFVESLDFERTFGVTREEYANSGEIREEVDLVIADAYRDFKTGNHIKTGQVTFKGRGGSGPGFMKERVFHFQNGRAFNDYRAKYSGESVSENIERHMMATTRALGMARKVGPGNLRERTDALIKMATDMARKAGDDASLEELASTKFQRQLDIAINNADGSSAIPGNSMIATAFGAMRTIIATSKLGSAMLAAVTDPVNFAAEAKLQGATFLSGYAATLQSMLGGIPKELKKDIVSSLGLAFDSMRGTLMDTFHAGDKQVGKLAKMSEIFYKVSGLGPFTQAQRNAGAIFFSSWVAIHAGKSFDELPGALGPILKSSGIGAEEWAVLSKHAVREMSEGEFSIKIMSPEAIGEIDDAAIGVYLKSKGIDDNALSRRKARTDLEDSYRSYLLDSSLSSTIDLKARNRGKMMGKTDPGDIPGAIWRSMMQFKSFPIAIMAQRFARDVSYRGGIKNVRGWGPVMGMVIAQQTAMGYVAMSLKDIAKGKEPRDPTDPKTFFASIAQGGGLGIWGDFLFAETNRFGGGFASTLAGPTAGVISDIQDLVQRARNGDDTAGHALRFIYNNTPFANLFYSRAAVDYFFMNRVFEEINPGFQSRVRSRAMREHGQNIFIPDPGGF